ncbi:MAG: VWA domain-containing protein, partial [Flavobacteriaceae bacterium]|nr:VWA domain-containing protein [Flavobacteriaceae bacterium]NNK52918.1 VWA domain-containing protein [Flavobacteriaceae bacterium]NNM09341.1 VWA domain-containing protein [Flavobacteriaceae bacterium]
MKKQLPLRSIIMKKAIFLFLALVVFSLNALKAQDITLQKDAIESTLCNQFDITLSVTGNPPPIPQEVILVIDRSGSMGFDIPGDTLESIDYAIRAANAFVSNLLKTENNPTGLNRVGIVSYSTSATVDYPLSLAADSTNIKNAIDGLVANGGTNIARAMQTANDHMENRPATFDCITSRSIILLTDGVTNRTLGGSSCTSSPTPPFPANNTQCMTDAINEGVAARTITIGTEDYNQGIFSVGLFGSITGDQLTAATFVLDQIQDKGLFTTTMAVDLEGIYDQILDQLALAAKMGVVTDVLGAGFQLVPGSLSDPVNASYNPGTNTITWNVGDVSSETLVLDYTIEAVGMDGCGIQNSGMSTMSYEDATCNNVVIPFPNPQVCVPCPDISDPVIDQVDCTNVVDYAATFDPGVCTPFSLEFVWEFFLNNVSVGTASGTTMGDLSGTFTYTGGDPFEGDFRAELTYNGTYNNNCNLPPVMVDSEIQVYLPPDMPTSNGDQSECAGSPVQTLTAQASVPLGESIVWYDAAVDGNVVPDPSLSSVGTVTYYAEAVDDTSDCVSLERVPVTLTLYNCAINIEKTASPNNPNECNPIPAGQDISYTFTVTNLGNVAITDVEVNDPLIDPNPIPGPDSGDTNNNGELDTTEVWTYTATYTVTQADIVNGQVENTVTVDGNVTGSSSTYNVNDEDTETVALCQNAEIEITKATDGDTANCNPYVVGSTINYTFTVTNLGDVDITNVVVDDPLLGGIVTGPAGGDTDGDDVLDVGEVWTYNGSYNVTQSNIDNGVVTNTATVDGDTALGPVDDTSNKIDLDICQNSSIALIKTSDVVLDPTNNCYEVGVGGTITYTFSVKNTGNVTLTGITVADLNPAVTVVGGPISLAPGAEDTTSFTASYTVTQADIDAGEFSNQATATGTPPSGPNVSDTSDNDSYVGSDPTVTPICTEASIALIKTGIYDGFDQAGNCIAATGDVINYNFSVKNTGNVTLTAVTVSDPLLTTLIGGPIVLAPGQEDTTTFSG